MIARIAGLLVLAVAAGCPAGAMAYDIAFTLDSTLGAGRNVDFAIVDPPQSVEVAPNGSQVLDVPYPTSGATPVFRFYEVRVTAKGENTMEYCAFSARADYLVASGWGCTIAPVRQTDAATCTGMLASGWNRSKPCAFQLRIQP